MPLDQTDLDSAWDFADPAASQHRLEQAARDAADPADRAEWQTQVARALGLQDRFAEAHAVLDELTTITTPAVVVRVALERGRVHRSAGDPEAAVPFLRRAAEDAAAAGLVFLQVDALHMLAIIDPAGPWDDRAHAVLDHVDDPRTLRWRVGLENNRGWSSFDEGRFDDALAAFERSREAAVRWGTEQQVGWADEAIAETRGRIAAPREP